MLLLRRSTYSYIVVVFQFLEYGRERKINELLGPCLASDQDRGQFLFERGVTSAEVSATHFNFRKVLCISSHKIDFIYLFVCLSASFMMTLIVVHGLVRVLF